MIKRKFLKGFNEFWFERNDLTVDTAAVVFDRSSIFLKIVPLFSWLRRPQAFSNTSVYFWCKVDIGNVYKVDLMGCCMFDARSWHCDISCCDIVTFHVLTLWHFMLWYCDISCRDIVTFHVITFWHFMLWHCDIWHCDISRIPINILLVWVQSTCTLYLIHINAICKFTQLAHFHPIQCKSQKLLSHGQNF